MTSTATWAPFACGVSYSTTTTLYDADLAAYGVPEITEAERTCETWTGSDYRLYVQDTGSSETDPAVTNDVKTSWYEYGAVRGFDAQGVQIGTAETVAADAFAFGRATAAEKQASYNDPYYGIYQNGNPEPCPNDPNAIICDGSGTYSRSPSGLSFSVATGNGMVLTRNPDAHKVGKKEHGLKRKALRALLASSDEIKRSGEGHRRFRSVTDTEETIITVDPGTELIVGQEVTHPHGKTKAKLKWKKIKRKDGAEGYVREVMEVEGEDENGNMTSYSTVVITDISFGGNP